MSKEKLPPEEGKDKGYIEISLPNLSGIKDKLDEGLERIEDAVDNNGRKYIVRNIRTIMAEDRVGLDPSYAHLAIILAAAASVFTVFMLIADAPLWILAFTALALLLSSVLYFLGKYEIRHDGEGFSTRIGKRELHRYAWSDVTDVADKRKIYVNGKRLFADASMHGFDRFYHRARVACKGKGQTVPSEKKRKNRKKQKNTRK